MTFVRRTSALVLLAAAGALLPGRAEAQRRPVSPRPAALGGSPVRAEISPKKSPRPSRRRSTPSIVTVASPSSTT
jgi:hypothetical protein